MTSYCQNCIDYPPSRTVAVETRRGTRDFDLCTKCADAYEQRHKLPRVKLATPAHVITTVED